VALAVCLLSGHSLGSTVRAQEIQTVEIPAAQVRTAHQARCGPAQLSTPGTQCNGWAGREILDDPELWVVGFENSDSVGEKHVYQTVAQFDLGPLHRLPEKAKISKATLTYTEASTTHRSPAGESEYGILPTCNTRLGAATSWDGNRDRIVAAPDAAVAGVMGATTASSGSWDVTPQLEQWHKSHAGQGVLVLRGDDEAMDVKGEAMCLSYIFDVGLSLEYTVPT
jgi:hypothetical protein